MTIKDCPKCGGDHYGCYRCPFSQEQIDAMSKEQPNAARVPETTYAMQDAGVKAAMKYDTPRTSYGEYVWQIWKAMHEAAPAQLRYNYGVGPEAGYSKAHVQSAGGLTRESVEHRINWLKQTVGTFALLSPDTEAEIDAIRDMALRSIVPAAQRAEGGYSYEASMLRNLLARIHKDGGHYTAEHGLDNSLEAAAALVSQWLTAAQPEAEALADKVRDFLAADGLLCDKHLYLNLAEWNEVIAALRRR